jgi:hypothetical protein
MLVVVNQFYFMYVSIHVLYADTLVFRPLLKQSVAKRNHQDQIVI